MMVGEKLSKVGGGYQPDFGDMEAMNFNDSNPR